MFWAKTTTTFVTTFVAENYPQRVQFYECKPNTQPIQINYYMQITALPLKKKITDVVTLNTLIGRLNCRGKYYFSRQTYLLCQIKISSWGIFKDIQCWLAGLNINLWKAVHSLCIFFKSFIDKKLYVCKALSLQASNLHKKWRMSMTMWFQYKSN